MLVTHIMRLFISGVADVVTLVGSSSTCTAGDLLDADDAVLCSAHHHLVQVLGSVKKYSESKDPLDCEHTPRTMETLVTNIVNKGAAGTAPDLRNKKSSHTKIAENLFMTNKPMMR